MIKIVSFHGRMRRKTFFTMTLLFYLVGLILVIPTGSGILSLTSTSGIDLALPPQYILKSHNEILLPPFLAWPLTMVGLLGLIWVVLSLIAISVRRLHDFGMTGFLLLILPVSQAVIPDYHWSDFLIFKSFYLILTLILAAIPGTRGSNAFGPDPSADGDIPS